jgi:hypothetical protein
MWAVHRLLNVLHKSAGCPSGLKQWKKNGSQAAMKSVQSWAASCPPRAQIDRFDMLKVEHLHERMFMVKP